MDFDGLISLRSLGLSARPSVRSSVCYFFINSKESRYLNQMKTTKGGSRRLEKSHKAWMMMMIAASLMRARAAEKPEQSKMTFKNHQNDSKQLT